MDPVRPLARGIALGRVRTAVLIPRPVVGRARAPVTGMALARAMGAPPLVAGRVHRLVRVRVRVRALVSWAWAHRLMSVLVSAQMVVPPTVTRVAGLTMFPEWAWVRGLGPVGVHTPRMGMSHPALARVRVYRLGLVAGRMSGQVAGARLVVLALVVLVARRQTRIRVLVQVPTPMVGRTPVHTRILELGPAQALPRDLIHRGQGQVQVHLLGRVRLHLVDHAAVRTPTPAPCRVQTLVPLVHQAVDRTPCRVQTQVQTLVLSVHPAVDQTPWRVQGQALTPALCRVQTRTLVRAPVLSMRPTVDQAPCRVQLQGQALILHPTQAQGLPDLVPTQALVLARAPGPVRSPGQDPPAGPGRRPAQPQAQGPVPGHDRVLVRVTGPAPAGLAGASTTKN